MMKINRRKFLKLGAAAGAALAAASYGYGRIYLANTDPEQYRHGWSVGTPETEKYREVIPSTCLQCSARCGIIGYVERGRLVKIEGNPFHPNNQGKICNKGLAGINQLYDPDRILYPMKRLGGRGEGKWKRISWDEAYGIAAYKLRELREGGRAEELYFHLGRDGDREFAERFCYAYGTPNLLDGSKLCTSSRGMGLRAAWGAVDDFKDLLNTRYILNFGVNFYEAHPEHLPLVKRAIAARVKNRAKLVTLDPRLSNTAGRSDEWFPIKPGTDGAIALAMANVIMQEELYDHRFVEEWVNYPAEKLKAHLRHYSPARAEKLSGMPAEEIKRIAVEFAAVKPALTMFYRGATAQYNGAQAARCIFLLDIITGNIGIRGGTSYPVEFSLPKVDPVPGILPGSAEAASFFPEVTQGKRRVSLYISYYTNPVYSYPDSKKVAEALKDEELIPYFIAIDSYMSETAALADLILPERIYLERLELVTAKTYERKPLVSLRQPLVEPLGETRSFKDICIELSRRIRGGMEAYFPFTDSEGYFKVLLTNLEEVLNSNVTGSLLNNGVWEDAKEVAGNLYEQELSFEELRGSVTDKETGIVYKDGRAIGILVKGKLPVRGFETPSRKIEVYSRTLEELGLNPLPAFEPKELANTMAGEFILTTFKWNVHSNSRTANCKWLSEKVQVNPIWINASVARTMRIDYGDKLKISAGVGTLVGEAFLTEGIHPAVIAVSTSCGHWEYGRIARAEKFESDDHDTGELWWDKNGINLNKILPVSVDAIGGAQTWTSAVKVEKL
jgi:anaerobic selenocysteine-containing dehydrogenase